MSKGSRLKEYLWCDIPVYPFSDTPDGRIVGELKKNRSEQKEYQAAQIRLMEKASTEMIRAHDNQQIIAPADMDLSETNNILRGLAYDLYGLQNFQEQTAESLREIGDINQQGFSQLHKDAMDLRGDAYPEKPIEALVRNNRDLLQVLAAFSKGLLSDAAISQLKRLIKKIFSSWINQKEKIKNRLESIMTQENEPFGEELHNAFLLLTNPESLLSSPEDSFKQITILHKYAQQHSQQELLQFLYKASELLQLYRKAQTVTLSDLTLITLRNHRLVNQEASHIIMHNFPEARRNPSVSTLNYHLEDVVANTGEIVEGQNVLIDQGNTRIAMHQSSLEKQDQMISGIGELVDLNLINVEQNEEMIEQHGIMINQGGVAIEQRETQLAQGNVQIQQGEVANYHLSTIVNNLVHLNEGVIDLQDLVANFIILFDRKMQALGNVMVWGFEEVIKRIALDAAMTRAAITAELAKVRSTIEETSRKTQLAIVQNSIITNQGNQLLAQLVDLTTHSQQNLAIQHFSDGMDCLTSAETNDDLADAYEAFLAGINAERASAENHFGAGIVTEMLGDLGKARDHFRKAGNRAGATQKDLAAKACELESKILVKMKDFAAAKNKSEEALKLNQESDAIRMTHARNLAFCGEYRESIALFFQLIRENESHFVIIRADNAFNMIPGEIKSDLFVALWKKKVIISPSISGLLLQDLLEMECKKAAVECFSYLFEHTPAILLDIQIWRHPHFNKYKEEFENAAINSVNGRAELLTANTYYDMAGIFFAGNIGGDLFVRLFQRGLEQDPDMMHQGDPLDREIIKRKIAIKCKILSKEITNAMWEKLKEKIEEKYQWIFNNN